MGRVLYENTSGGAYRAVGVMSTVTAHDDTDAYTNGLDYHYLSESGVWKIDGQFLHSHLDEEGTGLGGFVDVIYTPRTGLNYSMELSHFEDDLEINDLGFLRRNDVTGIRLGSEWVKSGLTRIRDFSIESLAHTCKQAYEEVLRPVAAGADA